MATQQLSFIRNRAYVAVSLTHFFVDVLNSGRTLLVAILAVSLGLSNAQVGLALLLYNVGSALAQPLFGVLADRFGPRWLVVGGMGWMILFYGLAAVAGEWPALVALTLAGLGSGAFHPTGAMVASHSSQEARTQATAVFFTAGQLGLFIGPLLAGVLLRDFGRPGYLALPLLALVAFGGGWRWLGNGPSLPSTAHSPATHPAAHLHPQATIHSHRGTAAGRVSGGVVLLLVVIIMTSSTMSIATSNFAPKLFTEQGYAADYVGLTAGLLMMGSAVGGLAGGALGDRFGRKPPILLGMVAAVLPVYLYVPASDLARLAWLFLAGFFGGMPHSILVLMVQALLPGRHALASGLTLGLMFFSGAVGSTAVGALADQMGDLGLALQWVAVLPLVAAGAALVLPAGSKNS